MSWSTSSIAWPARATSLRRRPELLALVRVEPGRGFVETKEPRPCCERPRNPDQLPLPLRQVGRHLVHLRLEAQQRQRLIDGIGRFDQ